MRICLFIPRRGLDMISSTTSMNRQHNRAQIHHTDSTHPHTRTSLQRTLAFGASAAPAQTPKHQTRELFGGARLPNQTNKDKYVPKKKQCKYLFPKRIFQISHGYDQKSADILSDSINPATNPKNPTNNPINPTKYPRNPTLFPTNFSGN